MAIQGLQDIAVGLQVCAIGEVRERPNLLTSLGSPVPGVNVWPHPRGGGSPKFGTGRRLTHGRPELVPAQNLLHQPEAKESDHCQTSKV